MPKKIKIGITGGIGSGKSIVSDEIEKAGFVVLRADPIAKDLMQNDDKLKLEIISAFGKEVFIQGKLNKSYLAENVFTDIKNVEKINSIAHPPTLKKIDQLANRVLQKSNLVFVESALIYEAKFDDMFDHVLLVYAGAQTRIKRAASRDKVDRKKIIQRMQFQIPDEEKKNFADFIIDNNSTVEELKQRTLFILNLLITLTK